MTTVSNKIKADFGFAENFSIRIDGLWLVIVYRGKDVQKLNIEMMGIAHTDYQVFMGELQGKVVEHDDPDGILEGAPSVTVTEIQKFIATYMSIQKKYTGRSGIYPVPTGEKPKPSVLKNWKAFAAATAQCKLAALYPNEYIEMLVTHYSRRASRSGSQVALPFPNQLQGQWAQNVIIEETARRHSKSVPSNIRASKLAGTNAYVDLDKDQAYLEARARIKEKKHTEFDIEYIKARLTQAFGQPKQWILDVETAWKAANAAAEAPKKKEDVSNG